MQIRTRWMAGGATLLALALLTWALVPSPREVETGRVERGRFERSVMEEGRSRVRQRFVVSSPLAGRVARNPLQVGDRVEVGQAVARLWPLAAPLLDDRARAEQAARLGARQASLARAGANVSRAQAATEQARADLTRQEALAQQGFVSANQNEASRLALRLREQELETARQEEKAARFDLEQARAALQGFTPGSSRAQVPVTVTAPAAGQVLRLVQQSEASVNAGAALVELGDPRQLEVVVDVLTRDAAALAPGTPVRLSNWGGPVLRGQVRRIEPAASTRISALGVEEQRVNVLIDITSAPDQWTGLGDGFRVDASLQIQAVDDALMVPVSAIFPVGSGTGLFLVQQGRARQTSVEVLARNGSQAWVRAQPALPEGAVVVIYPDSQLKDGERVKPRP